MRRLKTYTCKNPYHYFGFGTDDLIKVSFQRHEPRKCERFALIDRLKKKVKYITSYEGKPKFFHFATSQEFYAQPNSWWMIINALGWKVMITCD